MNILKNNYKIEYLTYTTYKLKKELADEYHINIIVKSHNALYSINQFICDDFTNVEVKEIKDIKGELDKIHFLNKDIDYINYHLITKDSTLIVKDVKDYHRMHFDLVSEDNTYGVIFFKEKMYDLSFPELQDILLFGINEMSLETIQKSFESKQITKKIYDDYEK